LSLGEAPDLGIYIHWPYCARICPYCDFNVYRRRGRGDEPAVLKDAMLRDLAAHRAVTGPRRLASVFLGGGTPSLMDPGWAGEMIEACRRLWEADDGLEVTLEANPTDAESSRFEAFAAAGVNRLSLGLQALNDADLALLGRDHDAAMGRRAAEIGARVFPRMSLDLIYARPGQSPLAWAAELREAAALGAGHLSPYQLTIEPGTAFERAVRRGRLVPPDEDAAAALYDVTQEVLSQAGFDAYEVSNHARGPAERSRHNLIYWTGGDYAGIGPGAHGRVTIDGTRHATEAEARPEAYIAKVRATGTGRAAAESLDPVAAAEERLLAGLRIRDGVPFAAVAALGLSPGHPVVAELRGEGLLTPDTARLAATGKGRLVLNWLTGRLVTG